MATLTIPDPTYERLKEKAAAMRLPLDEYLARFAEGNLEAHRSSPHAIKPGTPEWQKAFDSWVSSHPARPFIADDSRDAIYGEGRD